MTRIDYHCGRCRLRTTAIAVDDLEYFEASSLALVSHAEHSPSCTAPATSIQILSIARVPSREFVS